MDKGRACNRQKALRIFDSREMKIAFVTLGCKLNYAETSTYERGFRAAGLDVVGWREKADVYLVNTCTVTETANAKSRSEIRKLHRINPAAQIVVTGCYAQMKPDEVAAIEGVARVFLSDEKAAVVPETLKLLKINNSLSAKELSVFPAYSSGERTRSFLKVQDGCDNFCAYCTVPYARGRSRNIPICEAVRMAEEIASQGVKEIVLTGVNTGDFGKTTGESFLDLLKALNGVEGIERYRISSIEPNLLTEETVDWIASGTKFQPHFHIPLQTGCDELLKRMGRRYTTAEFADKLQMIRGKMERPGAEKVFFGIDVMVGLPGETPELFQETCGFLETIRPAFIHIFPYSKRPGTRAAEMPDQVPESIKKERVATLEALCDRLHAEFVEANRGIPAKVLWESKEKDGTMGGYTGNYIRITRPYDAALSGRITEIKI
ncbi:MAG: tRNA (N(6)-L-threonylcarbamoyladenosine(37)-C(2))-methylthiotransferase MtaB [Bacteroidales bacterium]|nr:tRNA (N(6)-L-threonylcarbamoyladenosine(37)-C(2))-methylthiotransferase MtaB [Bacteroidales bacterium]